MKFLLVCLLLSTQANPSKTWADGPVGIILSDVEKKAWSRLQTEIERQFFIDRFWAARDPNPETRVNEYQQEFNKRVETADTLFGGESGLEGWRTERGYYYVLLGAPASRAPFKGYGQLRPIELWFYSGKKDYPQLPTSFYLMFYQRDEVGDYRHYSPFVDQPQSLVKSTIRDTRDAYRVLSGINSDLARASLSLIPGEPVDTTSFTPSMTSDAILAQIHQIPRRDFERIGLLRELVNVKLKFDDGAAAMRLYPFLSGQDTFTVDLAIDRPPGLGEAKVETTVIRIDSGSETGPPANGLFSDKEPIVGRLVLKSGEYLVQSTVTDASSTQSYVARDVIELKPPREALLLSNIMFFRNATPTLSRSTLPFVHFGYQFNPQIERRLHQLDKLQVLFQVALPASVTAGMGAEAKPLLIDYTIASINNASSRWTFQDRISTTQFDANGLLMNSKTMSVRDLPPGRYYLIIMITDPAGHRASQTVSFEVTEASEPY